MLGKIRKLISGSNEKEPRPGITKTDGKLVLVANQIPNFQIPDFYWLEEPPIEEIYTKFGKIERLEEGEIKITFLEDTPILKFNNNLRSVIVKTTFNNSKFDEFLKDFEEMKFNLEGKEFIAGWHLAYAISEVIRGAPRDNQKVINKNYDVFNFRQYIWLRDPVNDKARILDLMNGKTIDVMNNSQITQGGFYFICKVPQ